MITLLYVGHNHMHNIPLPRILWEQLLSYKTTVAGVVRKESLNSRTRPKQ